MKEHFATAGPNELVNTEKPDGKVAGFWQGFWHGLIVVFAFVASLFKENVGIYESHNNGKWYNFGFILGLMIALGGNRAAGRSMQTREASEKGEAD